MSRASADLLGAGRRGDRISSPDKLENFLFSIASSMLLGPTKAIFSPGVMRPGLEVDHSTRTRAEMEKCCLLIPAVISLRII
jgi:hypothetical protein